MTTPKRPSASPGSLPQPPSRPSFVPMPSSVKPPSNIKDARVEALAVGGGAIGKSMPVQAIAGKKVVLIVDPDAMFRATLRRLLEPTYDVKEAKDGMEAVEMAPTLVNLGMIVSDVTMPRVDGFTLAKVIRQNATLKRVPIMFVSADNSPQKVTQALVLGACQFVPKPASATQIAEKIRKIVV